jgi:hypothetical protein
MSLRTRVKAIEASGLTTRVQVKRRKTAKITVKVARQ